MTRFIALDVETANPDYSTICQIGIVEFQSGNIVSEWSSYINPAAYFDPFNVSIHGITSAMVAGSPTFKAIYPQLAERLSGNIVLHHGHFDRTAFSRSYDASALPPIDCRWLDNTRVVRRTWPEFSEKGYGLSKLTKAFKMNLDHHDALSDARAAGSIFSMAMEKSGRSSEDWLAAAYESLHPGGGKVEIARAGNPEAPFYGEEIVFTGALEVVRSKAADVAQRLGFDVKDAVTKSTTCLCVGIQNPQNLAGYEKSSKQRKAEGLIQKGAEISILSERDFWALVKTAEKTATQ